MSQFARPNADISIGIGWTGATYANIDEDVYSDSDRNTCAGSTNDSAEFGLGVVSDPAVSTGHVVRFRAWQQDNTNVRGLTVSLKQGSTVIASLVIAALNKASSSTEYTIALTEAQADLITDYSALSLLFTSMGNTGTPSAARSAVYVSWAEVEVPEAVFSGINGSLEITFDDLTLEASGTVTVSGSAEISFDDLTLDGTGMVLVSGESEILFDDMTLEASGTVLITGESETIFDDLTLIAEGTVRSNGRRWPFADGVAVSQDKAQHRRMEYR